VGDLWLADIGIPAGLLESLEVDTDGLFAAADLIRLG
jgi:hypothetical protein